MSRCSIGIRIVGAAIRVAVVNVRSGDASIGGGQINDAEAVLAETIHRGGASSAQIVGLGIAHADSSSLAEAFSARFPDFPSVIVSSRRASVAGCGVASPSTMVMLLDESFFLMNSRIRAEVPGIRGPEDDAILPGYFGYEFDCAMPPGPSLDAPSCSSERSASNLGAFVDVRPDSPPETKCIALVEAAALDLHHRCELMRCAGIPVRRLVACGAIATSRPRAMQVFADVLDARIKLAAVEDPALIGAAIHGCIAAGSRAAGHASVSQIVHAMAKQRKDLIYRPDLSARRAYAKLYEGHRSLIQSGALQHVLRQIAGSHPARLDVP